MPPNEPASFTDEDRARVESHIDYMERFGEQEHPQVAADTAALTRALAYITHLEGALEAARAVPDNDEREDPQTGITYVSPRGPRTVLAETRQALARAALPTSKEDAG